MPAMIDERADEKQRQAILTILSGADQPVGTLFQNFSVIVSNLLEPLFLPIEFDMEKRTGRMEIPGVVEAATEPIRNPVTGAVHRMRIVLPDGWDDKEAEFASGSANGAGGALLMGFEHGAYCLGCRWVLMGLLFVGGIMNPLWVAAIAVLALIEKAAPRGALAGGGSGLLLVLVSLFVAVQSRRIRNPPVQDGRRSAVKINSRPRYPTPPRNPDSWHKDPVVLAGP